MRRTTTDSKTAQDYVLAIVAIEKRRKKPLGEIYAKIGEAVHRHPDTIKNVKSGRHCGEALYMLLKAYYHRRINERMHPRRYRVTAETSSHDDYNLVMEKLSAKERFEILLREAKKRV